MNSQSKTIPPENLDRNWTRKITVLSLLIVQAALWLFNPIWSLPTIIDCEFHWISMKCYKRSKNNGGLNNENFSIIQIFEKAAISSLLARICRFSLSKTWKQKKTRSLELELIDFWLLGFSFGQTKKKCKKEKKLLIVREFKLSRSIRHQLFFYLFCFVLCHHWNSCYYNLIL